MHDTHELPTEHPGAARAAGLRRPAPATHAAAPWPGSAPAIIWAMRQASHSREAEFVSLMTSLASTGMATGRRTAGSFTTMAAITQLLPYPVFAGPGADPSRNQEAAQTFLPRRRDPARS